MKILASDVGATKTLLGLFEGPSPRELSLVRTSRVPSRDEPSLLPIVTSFLAGERIDAAGFGVAGPVVDGICRATHLPWQVSIRELAQATGTAQVALLNDVAAAILGVPALAPEQISWLQRGTLTQGEPLALVTVGTGLGRALLTPAGIPLGSEGGHISFAPRSETELRLLRWLLEDQPHVAVEHVLSGAGLMRLYRFLTSERLCEAQLRTEAQLAAADDPNALVAELGLRDADPACAAAVAWFAELLGAELGNVALATIPRGGLYVWGGVALALQSALLTPTLHEAFVDKDHMRELLETIPLGLVLEPDLALLGAREAALSAAVVGSRA